MCTLFFFFQAEDGIRDLVRSRGLGDVYKRQTLDVDRLNLAGGMYARGGAPGAFGVNHNGYAFQTCLLYTSDAADERSSVDLGGRRIIKKKKMKKYHAVLRMIND